MIQSLPRSESLDMVLATWRTPPDDTYRLPEVEPFEECECEEDWHIPIAESKKKGSCGCNSSGGCGGSCGCKGSSGCGSKKAGRANRGKQRSWMGGSFSRQATPTGMSRTLTAPSTRGGIGGRVAAGMASSLTNSATLSSAPMSMGGRGGGMPLSGLTGQLLNRGPYNGMATDGSGPCTVTATSPPPSEFEPSEPAWLAWWQGCVPNGPVGPGVEAGCDLERAWHEALANCVDQCRQWYEDYYGEEWYMIAELECNDNFVLYAWINENCQVTDQVCGVSSQGTAAWADYDVPAQGEGGSANFLVDYVQPPGSGEVVSYDGEWRALEACETWGGYPVVLIKDQNGDVIGFWCEQLVPPQSPVQPSTPQGDTGSTGNTGSTGDTGDNTGDTGKQCRDCSNENWIHPQTYCMAECCGYEDCWPSKQKTDTGEDQDDGSSGQGTDDTSSPSNFIDVGCPPCCEPIVLC